MESVKRNFLVLILTAVLVLVFSCGSSGNSCTDQDGDGYGSRCSPGSDCNDRDYYTHPGAPEVCDGIDNNCNGQIDEPESINFADPNLAQAMIRALSLTTSTVLNTDLCPAGTLNLSSANITNLGGIEYAAQTHTLALDNNKITDITLLARLRGLVVLTVGRNNISSLVPLSRLSGIMILDVYSNKITDISPLSSMTGLTALNLSYNQNLTNISLLANMTNLQLLYIDHAGIISLGPVNNNPGIGAGDQLRVHNNPLDRDSCCSFIPALKSRGATITDDDSYCATTFGCP